MQVGPLARIAVVVVLAAGAASCADDDDGAPTATEAEFCSAFETFQEDVATPDEGAELGALLKRAAAQVEEVGTPEGIPADVRRGWELTLEAIGGLPDDATEDDVASSQQGFSESDQAAVEALGDYLAETCPDLGS